MFTTTRKSAWFKRVRLSLLVPTAIAAVVVASPAHAQNCSPSPISVLSRSAVAGTVPVASGYAGGWGNVTPDGVYCSLAGGIPGNPSEALPYDPRIINPGSTMVRVIWASPFAGPGSLTLAGLINGHDIKMTKVTSANNAWSDYWQSAWIPLDPNARGVLTATLRGDIKKSYHTIG